METLTPKQIREALAKAMEDFKMGRTMGYLDDSQESRAANYLFHWYGVHSWNDWQVLHFRKDCRAAVDNYINGRRLAQAALLKALQERRARGYK